MSHPSKAQIWNHLHGICLDHQTAIHVVLGPSRAQGIVSARRESARYLRSLGYSYPQIGRWLGGRHHTTIMNLCRREGWWDDSLPRGVFMFPSERTETRSSESQGEKGS